MATSVINNTITDPVGTALEGVRVTVRLMPCSGFRTATGTEVARVASTITDSNGAWSLTLEENASITPDGTYYEIVEYIPKVSGGNTRYLITVGASNQSVMAALVSPSSTLNASTFLTQAAADARYQQLGALGAVPTAVTPEDAGGEGVATAAARSDHEHSSNAAVPVSTGDANSEGTGTDFARATHVHKGVVNNDAWDTWVPSLTGITLGTGGTATGEYQRVGRTIHYRINIIFGTSGVVTATDPTFTLPVSPDAAYIVDKVPLGEALILDAGTANYSGVVLRTSGAVCRVILRRADTTYVTHAAITATVPMTWAINDSLCCVGTYEAAS